MGATASLAQPEPAVRPPSVETKVDAIYPADQIAAARQVTLVLRITIAADGSVTDPEVIESGGPAFDAAALAAVRQWRFRPALREGVPVPSRIRIPFLFVPPVASAADGGVSQQTANAASAPPSSADAGPTAPGAPPAPIVSSNVDAGVPGAPLPEVTAIPEAAAPAEQDGGVPDGGEGVIDVTVLGRRRPPSRGTSDYQIETAQLAQVPHANASDFLKLAPGFLLTNEGGEGHAEQVFLRGFDAREGQDLEFSVDGVPINESGNLHGNGYADTHFIIPELIDSIRVLEGPFDPRQGNYAVAGSAEYHLALPQRGLLTKLSAGSFGTRRVLLGYGPPGSSTGTFGAVQLYQTDGYGQNRDGRSGSAIAQWEGRAGDNLLRVTAQGYAASFHSAGVLREDDYQAGRVGFYDTYDPLQGEDASRYSISASLESHVDRIAFTNQVFAIYRPLRVRENFTGFLLDVQEPQQSPHGQRGELIDLNVKETTLGLRGSARLSDTFLGQRQEAEIGYFARHDIASGLQQRIEASTGHPYLTEANLDSNLDDIGLYVDGNLRLLRWLALRGGVRADLFTYTVHNLCAVQSVEHPSPGNPETDVSCQSQQNFGAHREPDQFASTSSTATMPRASILLGPWAGVSFSASIGRGVRSIDPNYITQDRATPFASIRAYEGGASIEQKLFEDVRLAAGTTFFMTRVDQDLIFDQTAGRNTLAGATTRIGSANALRVSSPVFDVNVNATFVRAKFDDTQLLIPYVPDLVVRGDGSIFHDLDWDWLRIGGDVPRVTLASGVTYVGPRPLPYGARSDVIFTIDANLIFGWPAVQAGFSVTNLLDRQYRLGEYNYASDFHSQPEPTLVPVRHFSAGAPREFLFTLTFNVGGTR